VKSTSREAATPEPRLLRDLRLAELEDLRTADGRDLTQLRVDIEQAAQAAKQALESEDADGVALALAAKRELQARVPTLEARLLETTRELKAARRPMVLAAVQACAAAVSNWTEEQRAASERIEGAIAELRAAVIAAGTLPQQWPSQRAALEQRLTELDPEGEVPRPTWRTPAAIDWLAFGENIQSLIVGVGQLYRGGL